MGEEVRVGNGRRERTAIIDASVNAQVVMNPKAFWRRARALCMVTGGRWLRMQAWRLACYLVCYMFLGG